jgi:hypothetical protein
MKLQITPDGVLQGQAETFWDFPRPRQTADVAGRLVKCDAPVRVSAPQRILPRAVRTDNGDSIAIGQLLSSLGPRVERLANGTYRVRGRPVGLFQGARTLNVRASPDGTISSIAIDYGETDYANVVAHFTRELGNPRRATPSPSTSLKA